MNIWIVTHASEKYFNITTSPTYERNDGYDHLRLPVATLPIVFRSLKDILTFIRGVDGAVNLKVQRNVPKSVYKTLKDKNNDFHIPGMAHITWETKKGQKCFLCVSVTSLK